VIFTHTERWHGAVGVGGATRPLTSGEYFDEDGTRAFLSALREQYGERALATLRFDEQLVLKGQYLGPDRGDTWRVDPDDDHLATE
jgi:hypothetical protein